MDFVIALTIVIGVAVALQIVFSMIQMKHFSSQFVQLRKRGKVAIGRQNGAFFAGAIVMFLIDDEGIIVTGKKLEGITSFARVKPLDQFNGKFVGALKADDGPDGHKNLCKAIADAANTYNKISAGEIIPEKPSPAKKFANILAKGVSRKD